MKKTNNSKYILFFKFKLFIYFNYIVLMKKLTFKKLIIVYPIIISNYCINKSSCCSCKSQTVTSEGNGSESNTKTPKHPVKAKQQVNYTSINDLSSNVDLSTNISNINISHELFPGFKNEPTTNRQTGLCKKSILDNTENLPDEVKKIIDELDKINPETKKSNFDSIIDELISDNDPIQKENALTKLGMNIEEQKALGCILGMAIGDTLGSKYEFGKVDENLYDSDNYENYLKNKLNSEKNKKARWTDDTSMGLCLLDSLIVNNGELNQKDLKNRFLLWWSYGYNNGKRNIISGGLGGQISRSLTEYLDDPKKITAEKNSEYDSGNGSIMRNAAIPLMTFFFNGDKEKLIEYSKLQSKTTHSGNEAADCCIILTLLCSDFIAKHKDKKDCFNNIDKIIVNSLSTTSAKGLILSKKNVDNLSDIDEKTKQPKKENWNWKDKIFSYNKDRAKQKPGYIGSYAMDALAMALHIFHHTKTFEDAIKIACFLKGDADSVAAVVGQIAGAYYGVQYIPNKWIQKIVNIQGGKDLIKRALILMRLKKQ